MRRLAQFLLVGCFLVIPATAQRGGGGFHGGMGGGFHGGMGGFHSGGFFGPGFRGGFVNGGFRRFRGGFNGLRNHGFRNNAFLWGGAGWGYPSYYDGYADSNYDGNGYQSLIIPEPEQESWAPIVVQPPPPPVRPEIHEYTWPKSATNAVFSIVAKDGSVQSAVAVWVQGNSVRYISPEGTAGHLPLDSVNRQATRRANSEKNLTLALPAGQGPSR